MIPTIPCLQAFIEPVAVCLSTVRVTTALASLEQLTSALPTLIFQDRLVLVDEQQHAIGWVSSQHLLKHLMKVGRFDQAFKRDQFSRDQSFKEPPLAGQSHVNEHSASDQPLIEITPSLVAPLVLLSATLPIDQFLPYLHAQPHACYGVETSEGDFLGLLDTVRLLEFLTRPVLELGVNQTKTPLVASFANGINQGADPSSLSGLLRELLEHLPLPVMLQTQDGRVLAQNSNWRNQVSELLDPGWLRQEVAALLETTAEVPPLPDRAVKAAWEHSIAALGQPHLRLSEVLQPFVPSKSHSESMISEKAFSEMSYLDEVSEAVKANDLASACHIGTKPGTCICVCPLKDGQEQVLQFVRIPIGTLASHADLAGRNRPSIVTAAMEAAVFDAETTAASPFFRLATLLSNMQDTQSFAQGRSHVDQNEDRSLSAPEAIALDEPIPITEELWLVLAQDITEQEELARELTAKNADLIQLNRLKDEFLACISHELRTPLTAVLGLSSLLKDQTLGALNPRQVHYAQLIHQSGRHLMAVVNNILDLTRIETGQLELVVEAVDIKTVCQRAFEQAQQLRQQEKNQNAADSDWVEPTFSLQLEPGLELLVADEQRLRQMLVHLLSNALKFTESNDPIGLKVGHWGGWIAFTVWDTGIGIPPAKQHLIFQKFQQLENPLTRRFEGTGLGLVLTQRLARLHGGDVTFVSKENQGSQFTILLPPKPPGIHPTSDDTAFPSHSTFDTGDRTAQVPPDSLTHPLKLPLTSPIDTYALDVSAFQRNQLVLIVEAVPQCIEALSDQLTGLGYRVVIARSGTEALEKARRLQPCVIFLNPVLPLLSGWDVLTLLKSNLETRRLPVVITATKVDEDQSHQRHADHLLSLPIQPKALQRCIQQLVVDLQETQPARRAAKVLTVLRLSPGVWSNHHQPLPTADLNLLLHSRQHRMLEADDLEQAELLARVWKPDVVLLDGILSDRAAYFQQYSQHIFLASLPLVTIDPETTQVANQVPGLLVFPCLSTIGAQGKFDAGTESSALSQVVQVAAGYALRPSILALDAATLPASLDIAITPGASDSTLGRSFKETEWLQALTQYLNTAGMRGLVGRCWQEVLQQVESYSVDVLLLCWTDDSNYSLTSSMLTAIHKLPNHPPILVLDHRQHHQPFAPLESSTIAALPPMLEQIAAQVLPASLPMSELLKHIHQAIRASKG